ncbi:MAG: hypothetical protein IJA32_09735 [Lachnospiraceae bacterium]|nr:hypothetical protein [Lachnospiraceae bacterium]
MKYRNAAHILPDELLREIQKYTEGEAIYIPKKEEKRKWGEGSGARKYYEERNKKICAEYKAGKTVDELAKEYHLSIESIRRIVYRKG